MSEDAPVEEVAQLEATIRTLQADNIRLRRLLDARDAPGELRHRQRNMLAMLRGVIRRSSKTEQDLSTYTARLEDRLDAIARLQYKVDTFGEVNLHGLLADELLTYAAREGEAVDISGPDIHLYPQAAQVFALALHELAVNAVEHGVLASPEGRLAVAWSPEPIEAGVALAFSWKETGLSGLAEPCQRGFGTEVLCEMLRFELSAETALAFEPDGLRCTIVLPFPARVGRIETEAPRL